VGLTTIEATTGESSMVWMNLKDYSFTHLSVFLNVPAKSGVYTLHTSSRCIYVGEAGNLREALYGHLRGNSPWITVWAPSGFSFELRPEVSRAERKNQIIIALRPAIKECDGDGDALVVEAPQAVSSAWF
jgi:hypothetical protein